MPFFNMDSPIGNLQIQVENQKVTKVEFRPKKHKTPSNCNTADREIFELCQQQLIEYFNGKRTSFDLPVELRGTEFQKSVWKQLEKIPFGKTISYKELAIQIGNPLSVRAVGAANGKNPVSIIIPCHRVIGSNGSLTGYGGGIERKEWLLEHEQKLASGVNLLF